ncbi:uncharacterized protein [Typha angustifolia]|uniref:uncharacterized protein n=1 Tax=Typha angustifolia TaxID=59011 RepID=UPI003C2F3C29
MLPKLSSSVYQRRRLFQCLFHFSTTATATATTTSSSSLTCASPSPSQPHFMAEYLVSSCGFSPSEAAKASQSLSHLKTPEKPNCVVEYLESRGFDKTQLKKLLSSKPKLLCSNVETTFVPKFQALEELGFSRLDLNLVLVSNPQVFHLSLARTVVPRIQFWLGLIGTNRLAKILRDNTWFLSCSIERTVAPNLALLRDCGISDKSITLLSRRNPSFILRKPEKLRALVERVKGLGIPLNARVFPQAMWTLNFVSTSRFKAKLEAMRSFGWSEVQFLAAFRKSPTFLTVSEMTVRAKMEFFVKEIGCEPDYFAQHPQLLTYSLEKRMLPRHRVLTMLEARGLHSRKYKISTILLQPDEMFLKNFILPYKEEVPWLQEMYAAECGRRGST